MIDYQSHSARTLLAIAERQNWLDAERSRLVFSHLHIAACARGFLRAALARHNLSDLQFATLVDLAECGPHPVPMSVLARNAGVSRPSMTDALNRLEQRGLASRVSNRPNRRVTPVRITAAGRAKVLQAIHDYLQGANQAARCINGSDSLKLFA